MKKATLYGLTLSAALLATTAIAQVFVDKTKMREWNGGKPTDAQIETMAQRHSEAVASRAKYNNIVTPTGQKRIASTNPDILPNDVIDDGTRINFNVINWFMGDFIGIGSMRPVAGTPVESVAPNVDFGGNAIYANGKMYGLNYISGGGQVIKATFVAYDAKTWELEKSIELPAQWYSVWDMGAYDPKSGKIYLIGYDGRKTPYLSELDPETGTYTQLVFCPVNLQTMAFDTDGKLYALTTAGEIELVDLTTGLGTPLFRVEDEGVQCYYWHSIAFDYHTGELFWIRTDNNFMTDLRKIDLEAKTVEVVSDLPDFGALCAWVESPEAEAKAPSTVEKLFVEFGENGSHVGTVNITAPSVSFDGSALDSDVTVYITVDDKFIGDLTLAPGQAGKIADVDFLKSGEHKVLAIASNDAGDGPKGTITAYCGPDTPSPVSDVTMTVAADGTASLSWNAPTGGIHQGYFNGDLLTYDIVRYPDQVEVATGIKETTFTETLPNTLDRYYYTVTVACDGIPGDAVASNSIVYGDGMEIPFNSALGGEDFFNLCTVHDLDGDGNTWYETWGSASCYTGYHDSDYTSDDWYITPPISLAAGNYFVETTFAGISAVSSLEFTFGDSQSPADHKILESFTGLTYDGGEQVYRTYIMVPESGKHYFGYHFTSKVAGGEVETPYLTLRNLKIEAGPANDAPEAVTAVSAVPAELGKLETTISFTTPSTMFNGNALTSLDRVEICSATDGEVIGTVSPVEPGKAYEFVHENAVEGYNTYHIYACNESGRGKITEIEAYAGNDLADIVEWLTYKVENNRVVTFEWGLPPTTGVRGGYVDPDKLTYNFCRSEYDWQEPFSIIDTEGLTERRFTWTECGPSATFGTAQHLYLYGIKAVTPVGEGRLGYTGIILGDPNQVPFIESFAGGYNNTTGVWTNQLVDGVPGWSITTGSEEYGIAPADDDNGMLLFSPEGESFHAVGLPLIELRDMQKPVIVFDMYHKADADDNAFLSVQISKNDENYAPLDAITAKAETTGWTEHKISLKDYNDCNRNFIALVGLGTGKSSTFAIDNIRVCDDLPFDIALTSLSAPSTMDLGETAAFKIKVEGKGMETVEEYTIDIYADGAKVASTNGTQLAPGASVELTANVTTNAANAGKRVNYEARVNLDADGNDRNDIASTTVNVGGSALPAPKNLTGDAADDTMTLAWTAPDEPVTTAVNESFESWTSFVIEGENGWKFYDGDRLSPYGIQGVTYPNMDKGRAWMVWAPGELEDFAGKNDWMPKDGSKCLIAFASSYMTMDGELDFGQLSDEWLISPHVAGGTELKFMAGVPAAGNTERFEVMVSYGGRNPEDFTRLGETEVVSETGWKQYSYTLPADVAYFAIHFVSQGWESFALMIDNIEYTAGYDEVELIGYNIYLNGMQINDEPVTGTTATAPYEASADNRYEVSALYYEGESEPAVLSSQSGIGAIIAGEAITVSGANGEITVNCAGGQQIVVYTTMGIAVDSRIATGHDIIPVTSGVYIVTVAGKSFKVIVK